MQCFSCHLQVPQLCTFSWHTSLNQLWSSIKSSKLVVPKSYNNNNNILYEHSFKIKLVISLFLWNKRFLIYYFTGSRFSISINSNLAILMMPQPQNHNFGSRRPQTLQFFCRNSTEWRPLTSTTTTPTPLIMTSSEDKEKKRLQEVFNRDLQLFAENIEIHLLLLDTWEIL